MMRKVTHENDHWLNQSFFRDFETNRAIRIDSVMSRADAKLIADMRGWDIVAWADIDATITPKTKTPGLLDRAFSFLRRK